MQHDALQSEFLNAFDAYHDAIFRFCLFKVSNREVAQDLTQETFMRYWQTLLTSLDLTSLDSFEGTEIKPVDAKAQATIQNERAYLYTIARNLIIDWYRKRKDASLDRIKDTGVDFEGAGAAEITDNASTEEILAVLKTLEDGDREVLLLRYVEGYGPQEIAKLLTESPNVVSVRIHRALKKLQEKLHIHEGGIQINE
jgi:RNA polymerase sigma-70 factor (ECF subfamily)